MIRVLIVDDSPVIREVISQILQKDPEISVIGAIGNGEDGVKAAVEMSPDLITMDINLPGINGLEATRRIMNLKPVPIIIVSSTVDNYNISTSFQAIEAGALAVMRTPPGLLNPTFENYVQELINTVKLYSEIKVVKRRFIKYNVSSPVAEPYSTTDVKMMDVEIVVIGASTGGPPVVATILTILGPNLSVPVLITQHMSPGFITGYAEWLSNSSSVCVRVPEDNEVLIPGIVYVAPDNVHMGVKEKGRIHLSNEDPIKSLRPSVGYLFRTVAETYGKKALAVILTGMGDDGASEMGLIRKKGGITIAQDAESSIVNGMPGSAISLGSVKYILPPELIAEKVKSLLEKKVKFN